MGISGKPVQTFSEANLALSVNVHTNGDYHFFFDILSIEGKVVKLKSHKNGDIWQKKIQCRKGQEYVTYEHNGFLQATMGYKPERVKIVPFSGERF